MRAARALTLVEVLAATVILAMLAGAVVPLLADARRTLEHEQSTIEIIDLEQLAADFVDEPKSFGFEDDLLTLTELTIPWPDAPDQPDVRISRIDTEDAHHIWLIFECDSLSVSHWLIKPKEEL